jgi:hypothetical protein
LPATLDRWLRGLLQQLAITEYHPLRIIVYLQISASTNFTRRCSPARFRYMDMGVQSTCVVCCWMASESRLSPWPADCRIFATFAPNGALFDRLIHAALRFCFKLWLRPVLGYGQVGEYHHVQGAASV